VTDLARRAALDAVLAVLGRRQSLSTVLPPVLCALPSAQDRAFTQTLVLGTLRFEPRLSALSTLLLDKPLKRGDLAVKACLLLGLYQIIYLKTPPHAAVSESVSLVPRHLPWARALVNAVLRRFAREPKTLLDIADREDVARLAHPQWLLDLIAGSWGESYDSVAQANNVPGPLTVRVNRRITNPTQWAAELASVEATASEVPHNQFGFTISGAGDPTKLPGFPEGAFAVQDGAAQLAAPLLAPEDRHRILDAGAAPGGKTGHICELAPEAQVTAVEKDATRIVRLRENLTRLHHQAQVVEGDACDPSAWWDGIAFDRIMLDAPCSATGVIRRHPDIKLLRTPEDIARLVDTQRAMLRALWPTLAEGGGLLYATCSVLRQENHEQILEFLAEQSDAVHVPIDAPWGREMPAGRQILPGEDGMDGFYYALLRKR